MGTSEAEVLATWVVEVDLPPHPGFGLRKREAPRPDGRGASAVLDSAQRSQDRWKKQRKRLRGHLARARRFEAMLETGEAENAAAISRSEGLSRARVSQLMALLRLDAEIIARLDDEQAAGPVPAERDLRKLATLAPSEQLSIFEEMVHARRER
jgi:hypothetical protein